MYSQRFEMLVLVLGRHRTSSEQNAGFINSLRARMRALFYCAYYCGRLKTLPSFITN
ncbi:hypothetical protein SAMN04487965_0668 [Microbulbifer donghaiensis]|uniref:Uncharacterized protein n=1 Tax=Microbulbifer donghaiensis TaxID=494016 RepID=A0A1M4WEM0_9GAMM|nr:hypothetical protein SAMN04487965_0668 [Microbulbifer donghaiensis]